MVDRLTQLTPFSNGAAAPDLLTVIGQDTRLRRKATTKGGEYCGSCPWCGGRDRFIVWPVAERPGYYCRQCERRGDAISYLRERHGLSFDDARREVGQRPTREPVASATIPVEVPKDSPPPEQWRRMAEAFVAWTERQLWGEAGAAARAYLTERRGLRDATIRRWRLGYNPCELSRPAERWGVADPHCRTIYLSRGIVIPRWASGQLYFVNIRRPLPTGDDLAEYLGPDPRASRKYLAIAKGQKSLLGVDGLQGRPAVAVTEGEFDAILLHQEAGDLVDVATMGDNATMPAGRWLWALRKARVILAAYDNDEAGAAGAARLAALSSRVRFAAPLSANDLTEQWQRGGNLRRWTRHWLRRCDLEAATDQDDNPPHEPCQRCGGRRWWRSSSDGTWRCDRCEGKVA